MHQRNRQQSVLVHQLEQKCIGPLRIQASNQQKRSLYGIKDSKGHRDCFV